MIDTTWLRSRSVFLFGIFLTLLFCGLLRFAGFQGGNPWLERLEYLFYDWRFAITQVGNNSSAPVPIVIVDIDEASLAGIGRWPWSRYQLALLLQALGEYEVSVIGLDMVFAETEAHPVDELIHHAEALQPEEEALLANLKKRMVGPDEALATAMQTTDLVPGFFFQDSHEQHSSMPAGLKPLDPAIPYLYLSRPGVTPPLPVFLAAARSPGFLSTFADHDGVIRRTPLLMSFDGQLYPSLSLAVVMQYWLESPLQIQEEWLGDARIPVLLTLAGQTIRPDASGRVVVPYRGGRGMFPYISAIRVLQHQVAAEQLEGAIVLLGTSAMGLGDLRATPLATQFPGVEVHASVIQGLLSGDIPYRPGWQPAVTLLQTLLSGLLLVLWLPRLSAGRSLTVSLLLVLVLTAVNLALWHYAGLDLPLAATLLLCLLLVLLNLGASLVRESSSRRQLRSMFGQYVPAEHIQTMLDNPDAYHFHGETRDMTVLFSDICSFTRISEGMSANELKQLLNEHFTPLTRIIFEHGGTIDKYVGDLLMAFWGAPLSDTEHARHALLAALAMSRQIDERQALFRQRGWPEVRVGIGIHSGSMNVGDMGSSYRRAYTVLGDAVNLGSRLEGLTRFYGVTILASSATRDQVTEVDWRFVDRIQVKGRDEPLDIFEPLGLAGCALARAEELRLWQCMVDCYRQQQWPEALALAGVLTERFPQPLYACYRQRLQLWCDNPPPDWNGTFRHDHK
jgi:adenylate cyclase